MRNRTPLRHPENMKIRAMIPSGKPITQLIISIFGCVSKKTPNGLRYPLVGGMRQRRFDGTNSKPRKLPQNAQSPTSRVHAVLARFLGQRDVVSCKGQSFSTFRSLKCPSVPTSTQSPIPPETPAPCFRSFTTNTGCSCPFK